MVSDIRICIVMEIICSDNEYLHNEICFSAPFQYPIRRLIVRPREVEKPCYLYLEQSYRSEI